MTDRFSDMMRRAIDANVRYYEAWGRVVGDYVRDLGDAAKDFKPRIDLPAVRLPTVATSAGSRAQTPTEAAEHGARPAVVLEGPVGATATAAVLVENHLAHPVSAAIHAEVDGDIDLSVDPETIDLAPGESAVVRVSALISSMADEVAEVRGQLLVPDLVGTAVPLIIRAR